MTPEARCAGRTRGYSLTDQKQPQPPAAATVLPQCPAKIPARSAAREFGGARFCSALIVAFVRRPDSGALERRSASSSGLHRVPELSRLFA